MIKVMRLAEVVKRAGGEDALRRPLTNQGAYYLLLVAQNQIIDAYLRRHRGSEVVELSNQLLNDYVEGLRWEQADVAVVEGLTCWARAANGAMIRVEVTKVMTDRYVVVKDALRGQLSTIDQRQLCLR